MNQRSSIRSRIATAGHTERSDYYRSTKRRAREEETVMEMSANAAGATGSTNEALNLEDSATGSTFERPLNHQVQINKLVDSQTKANA